MPSATPALDLVSAGWPDASGDELGTDSAATPEGLRRLRERTGPLTLASERTLPVAPGLRGVLPGGLQRGNTVTVSGNAGVSLALALVGEATRTGSWLAVLGAPWLGWPAAAELGVALERVIVVDDPGPQTWVEVAAALLDGFDVVVAPTPFRLRPVDARRLARRASQHGSVLVPLAAIGAGHGGGSRLGGAGNGGRASVSGRWPEAAEVECRAITTAWTGIGAGHGHLAARRARIEVGGRRQPRARTAELWLPGPQGEVAEVVPMASVAEIGA